MKGRGRGCLLACVVSAVADWSSGICRRMRMRGWQRWSCALVLFGGQIVGVLLVLVGQGCMEWCFDASLRATAEAKEHMVATWTVCGVTRKQRYDTTRYVLCNCFGGVGCVALCMFCA